MTVTATLTGSRAMRVWFPDAREPKDWDWIAGAPGARLPALSPGQRNDVLADARLLAWNWGSVATPDELYTMKVSHSFWEVNGPRNWDKHAADIVFLSRKGAEFIRPLYDILLPVWKERHRKNLVNTHQGKDAFFADAVNRKYDHDSVHESVSYYERPLYESYLADGETVRSDWAKFEALPFEVRLQAVREEVYATALERILIPANYKGSPGAAYRWALRRTATSLFKGEWALFLVLNLDALARPDCDYKGRHLQNLHKLKLTGEEQ